MSLKKIPLSASGFIFVNLTVGEIEAPKLRPVGDGKKSLIGGIYGVGVEFIRVTSRPAGAIY